MSRNLEVLTVLVPAIAPKIWSKPAPRTGGRGLFNPIGFEAEPEGVAEHHRGAEDRTEGLAASPPTKLAVLA